LSVYNGFNPFKGHGYFIRLYIKNKDEEKEVEYLEFQMNNETVFPAQKVDE
jgi:hypothetical protein